MTGAYNRTDVLEYLLTVMILLTRYSRFTQTSRVMRYQRSGIQLRFSKSRYQVRPIIHIELTQNIVPYFELFVCVLPKQLIGTFLLMFCTLFTSDISVSNIPFTGTRNLVHETGRSFSFKLQCFPRDGLVNGTCVLHTTCSSPSFHRM